MKKYESDKIRNIAFIGHGGDGKTSLVEAILYDTGRTDRLGRVDEGTSAMDYEPEEIKRKITIGTSFNYCEYNKHKIALIDTPGDANFVADTKACLRVADGAVLVVDAVSGVKVGAERVWNYTRELNIPVVVFISKLDRERSNFEGAVESLRKALGEKFMPLQIPIGKEADFKGYVDLLSQKAFTFIKDGGGKMTEGEIPADLKEDAKNGRDKAVEDIAETEDELVEKYLENQSLSPEEIAKGLSLGVKKQAFVPVLCGSGTGNIGVQALLDLLVAAMPSPLERPVPQAAHPSDKSEIAVKADPQGPFLAQVFKTIADPYAGRLTIFRVYSGTLNNEDNLYNVSKDAKERVGQLFLLEGKKQQPVPSVTVGDIAAMAKLKETTTNDTLSKDGYKAVFPAVASLNPVISYALKPKEKGDEEKISISLARLLEEDPSLRVHRDEQTREFILSGMGQVHLEVTLEKMKRKFGLEVTLQLPKVPYKETLKGSSEGQSRYKKQTGGRGQFGDTFLRVETLPRGSGFEFVDKIVGGAIPRQYIPAVEKGIVEAMTEGVLAGYPMVDFRVTLYDGSYHNVDSSEMAFKIAGSMGFKKFAKEANPTLLEPVVTIEVTVPEEFMGDIIGDLNSRRGRILGMDTKGRFQVVKAHVPLAEVLRYSPDLESMTGGRGSFSLEFSHYEEVPAHLIEKIVAEHQKEKEAEK